MALRCPKEWPGKGLVSSAVPMIKLFLPAADYSSVSTTTFLATTAEAFQSLLQWFQSLPPSHFSAWRFSAWHFWLLLAGKGCSVGKFPDFIPGPGGCSFQFDSGPA